MFLNFYSYYKIFTSVFCQNVSNPPLLENYVLVKLPGATLHLLSLLDIHTAKDFFFSH